MVVTPPAPSFAALGLHPALLRALQQRGHLRPTAIQAQGVPAALAGHDLMGAAVTGSGKTLAYVLPLLQGLLERPPTGSRPVRGLVLVPTRELALQVTDTLLAYAQALALRVKVVTLHGGVSVNPQLMALRGGADVLVATPGRLLDVAGRRRSRLPEAMSSGLRLDQLETLVLDEADRLLDEGFTDELQQVLDLLPPQRRHWLYSATFGPEVMTLARRLLNQPVLIDVQPSVKPAQAPCEHSLPPTLVQRAFQVDTARRTALLRHLLRTEGWSRVLVFVASRHACEHLAQKLHGAGVRTATLHGDLSQGARADAMADFRRGAVQVLVATDMAARGLHVDGLPAVVNYDLARSPATHIHRVGRTARQGAAGVALSFIAADDPRQEAHFRLIEKRQGLRVPREHLPGFEPTTKAQTSGELEAPRGLDPQGGIKGRRKSKKDKLREAQASAGVKAMG